MEENKFDTFETQNQFHYSAVPMDELGATEYTIVNLLIDTTGSMCGFQEVMAEGVQKIVKKLQGHPKSENLLFRVATFESWNGIQEIHGFTPINSVDVNKYKIETGGATPLYDATLDSIETTKEYAENLIKSGNVDCLNSIYFVLTDGEENDSDKANLTKIKEAMDKIRRSKDLESTMSILIGVNSVACENELKEFHRKAGFNHYLTIEDIEKLTDFIENAVSSTSMVLGTGQSADLNI
jgi:uncharacterized protein YegL